MEIKPVRDDDKNYVMHIDTHIDETGYKNLVYIKSGYVLWDNGQRIGIAEVKDNRQRFRVHDFPGKEYHAFHLKIKSTWGDPSARIFQIRVYRSRFIPASTVKEYSATLHGQSGTESQR